MKISERWAKLRKRISKKNEARFLKKHCVGSWREYDLKYDVDYAAKAASIRYMFHGYPYIAELTSAEQLKPGSPHGLEYLKNWLENSCRGKARCVIERTLDITTRDVDGRTTYKDWAINGIGGRDSLFVAFQDERDYMMFLLKWETS